MARASKRVEEVVEDSASVEVANEVEAVVDEVEQEATLDVVAPSEITTVEVEATVEVEPVVDAIIEHTTTPFLNYGGFTVEEVKDLIAKRTTVGLSGEENVRWRALQDEAYRAYGTMRQMVASANECPSSAVTIEKVLDRYQTNESNKMLFSTIVKVHTFEQVELIVAVLKTRAV